jgi:hypothetical protein
VPNDTQRREDRILEAQRIIDTAQAKHVLLRLLGGLAIRRHCEIINFCERDYADIDLVGLRKQAAQIIDVMETLGYKEDPQIVLATGGQRMLFHKRGTADHIDVFLDTFQMEHTIDLRHRLTIEPYTISISDLLLSKLQIYQLNEKDVRDILTIIKDIPLGIQDSPRLINVNYLATLCAKDWGLFTDVNSNIDKTLHLMNNYTLSLQEREQIQQRLHRIKAVLEHEPKSLKWKLRKRLGKRKTWRREVEDQLEAPQLGDGSFSRP